jgi:hypothetical protein
LGVNVTIPPQVHPNQDGSSPNFQSPKIFLHEITANKRPTAEQNRKEVEQVVCTIRRPEVNITADTLQQSTAQKHMDIKET